MQKMNPDTSNKENIYNQKSQRVSDSELCGLIFPVSRLHKWMKRGRLADRISKKSAVGVTSALEYLVADLIESTALRVKAGHSGVKCLRTTDICRAINNDPQLSRALGPKVTIIHNRNDFKRNEVKMMETQMIGNEDFEKFKDCMADEGEEGTESELGSDDFN
jgi:histone H3/H4